jgi:hypothetical protein
MRFAAPTAAYYCGIDLHARTAVPLDAGCGRTAALDADGRWACRR